MCLVREMRWKHEVSYFPWEALLKGMRLLSVIIIFASIFLEYIVMLEEGIEDKDIPEERAGDDTSGSNWILKLKFDEYR